MEFIILAIGSVVPFLAPYFLVGEWSRVTFLLYMGEFALLSIPRRYFHDPFIESVVLSSLICAASWYYIDWMAGVYMLCFGLTFYYSLTPQYNLPLILWGQLGRLFGSLFLVCIVIFLYRVYEVVFK